MRAGLTVPSEPTTPFLPYMNTPLGSVPGSLLAGQVRNHPEAGSTLLITLNVTIILTAMSAAFLSVAFADSEEHRSAVESSQAFYIAEAGLNVGVTEIRSLGAGQSWSTGTAEAPVPFGSGGYRVTVTPAGANAAIVVSVGTYGGTSRAVEGVVSFSQTGEEKLYEGAVGGEVETKILDNAITDSYDSSQGSYLDQRVNRVGGRDVANSNGDVFSNGPIVVDPTAHVFGDAMTDDSIMGGAEVEGSTIPTAAEEEYPTVTPPDMSAAVALPSIALSGGSTRIDPGVWDLAQISVTGRGILRVEGPATIRVDRFQVGGNAALIVEEANGPVYFYVDERFRVTGSAIVRSQGYQPKAALFFLSIDNYTGFEADDDGDEANRPIKLQGSADFYGVLYAPQGTVSISGSAEVFGTAYGKKLVVNGDAAIHFDEQLLLTPGISKGGGDNATSWTADPGGFPSSGEPALVTWREVSPQEPAGPQDGPGEPAR